MEEELFFKEQIYSYKIIFGGKLGINQSSVYSFHYFFTFFNIKKYVFQFLKSFSVGVYVLTDKEEKSTNIPQQYLPVNTVKRL